MVALQRRWVLAAALLAGCGTTDSENDASPAPLLMPWRTLDGGFLGRPSPALGVPASPGTGMFTRFLSPTALALRGSEMLLADAGRLWRIDAFIGTMAGVPGAAAPGVVLALGPDGSAWVMDPGARRLLRIARDGRVLQDLRPPLELGSPSALAFADGGATLLLADGLGARWLEWRGGTGPVLPVTPLGPAGQRAASVDGLAVWGDEVFVLDRLGGAVHRVRRDGQLLATLGRGQLQQPVQIGVDRWGRVFALDTAAAIVFVLWPNGAAQRLSVSDTGLRRPTALAVDGSLLALADGVGARVQLWRLGAGAPA